MSSAALRVNSLLASLVSRFAPATAPASTPASTSSMYVLQTAEGAAGHADTLAFTAPSAPRPVNGANASGPAPTPRATETPSPLAEGILAAHSVLAGARLSALALAAALASYQERVLVSTLWTLGSAAETARHHSHSLPPPDTVPPLLFHAAYATATTAQEGAAAVFLQSSSAAVGAVTHAATGAADVVAAALLAPSPALPPPRPETAAVAAAGAPHAPLLRLARRRLHSSASGLLASLYDMRSACTTHAGASRPVHHCYLNSPCITFFRSASGCQCPRPHRPPLSGAPVSLPFGRRLTRPARGCRPSPTPTALSFVLHSPLQPALRPRLALQLQLVAARAELLATVQARAWPASK